MTLLLSLTLNLVLWMIILSFRDCCLGGRGWLVGFLTVLNFKALPDYFVSSLSLVVNFLIYGFY